MVFWFLSFPVSRVYFSESESHLRHLCSVQCKGIHLETGALNALTLSLPPGGGSGFNCWGVRARVTLILHECIWNAPAISLILIASGNTGSLDFNPRQVIYIPGSMVSPWVTASRFLAGYREAELKPNTFWSLLLFCFHLFPSSADPPPPSDMVRLVLKHLIKYFVKLKIKMLTNVS